MAQNGSYSNIGMMSELIDLQEQSNRLTQERNQLIEILGPLPPAPPPSRVDRLRWRVRDAREALARRIAPWLEDD